MKVTIEFDNPDEAVDALNLWKYQSIITEVLNFTGNKFKGDPLTEEAYEAYGSIRKLMFDSAKDLGIEI